MKLELIFSSKESYWPYIPNKPQSIISGKKKHVLKVNVKQKRKDLSKFTPSSNFCDGKGEGLFLSNGERPNSFPELQLLNGEALSAKYVKVPNLVSDITIQGNFGMVEETALVENFAMGEEITLAEDVQYGTGVPSLGAHVECDFGMDEGHADGMDEGHAEDDQPPTLAANLVEVPNPGSVITIRGNFGSVKETNLVEDVHAGTGIPDLAENDLRATGVDEGHVEDDRPPTIPGNLVVFSDPGSDITIPGNLVIENRKMKRELEECENQMKKMKRDFDVLRRTINPHSLVSNEEPCFQSKTLVLSALDVVVEMGCQSYGFVSHSGNLVLNNEIIQMLEDYSSIHCNVKTEWISLFILRFKKG